MASECGVKVFCRFRPLNKSEIASGSTPVMKFPHASDDCVNVLGKTYVFDKVFQPTTLQEKVYKEAAYPIVQDVLSGYNGTIFAYGQTSSGKTHTMEGVLGNPLLEGIIPRIVTDIFDHITKINVPTDFLIKVSYFEIYLDKIQDLLDVEKRNLAVHEDKNGDTYVKDCTERFVTGPEEVLATIEEGKNNRHIAVTNMNEHSSRSHSVLLVNVVQESLETKRRLSGKLYLVDLAGSEKVSKTGAEGSVLEEAKNINKSLSALGNVIAALADKDKTHVPYRDSKLTRILQQSLGGNARTTIIICCSPASFNEAETKSTLQFGQRAKTIKNVVAVNEELSVEEWRRRYEREREKVRVLREQLQALEAEVQRWRQGESVPSAEWFRANASVPAGAGGPLPTAVVSAFNASALDASSSGIGSSMMSTSESAASLSSLDVSSSSLLRPAASLSGFSSAVADEERTKFEAERCRLYRDLDEKDDEIQRLSQESELLKKQVSDLERLSELQKVDNEQLQKALQDSEASCAETTTQVVETISALEELGAANDTLQKEMEDFREKNLSMAADIEKYKGDNILLKAEVTELQSAIHSNRRRLLDSVLTTLKELAEVASEVAPNSELKLNLESLDSSERVDEELAMARLLMIRLKAEMRNICQRQVMADSNNLGLEARIDELKKEAEEGNLAAQQWEAKFHNITENLQECEAQRRELQKQLDASSDEYTRLIAAGSPAGASSPPLIVQPPTAEGVSGAPPLASTDKDQLETILQTHAKQLASLRDELADKTQLIAQLKDSLQMLTLGKEQLQQTTDRLKTELMEKEQQLKSQMALMNKREHAKQDLDGLRQSVESELASLLSLRKAFVQTVEVRIQRPSQFYGESDTSHDDSEMIPAALQKQRINFLENNLEQLTRVHKQLVRDNADLRLEVPKLERRLRATMERIKKLETALKETKEAAATDRAKYKAEVEQIKAAVKERFAKRAQARIVRPIHAGNQQQLYRPPALRIGVAQDTTGMAPPPPANAAAMRRNMDSSYEH